MELVRPTADHLGSYLEAVDRGWDWDAPQGLSIEAHREQVLADPVAFLALMDDPAGQLPPVVLPDGSSVARLPGIRRWMWDGQFAGSINLRWVPGTAQLPPTCLGHIGYGVVPWRRGRGYATAALGAVLPLARLQGLPYVEIVTDPDNVASQRVILANGGVLVRRFTTTPAHGGDEVLLHRIDLA